MATILPIKSNIKRSFALDDDHHYAMANDPTIPEFPLGSSYESTTTPNLPSWNPAYGSTPTANFGTTDSGYGAVPPVTNSWGSQPLGGGSGIGSPSPSQQQNQAAMIQSGGGAMQEGGTSMIEADNGFSDFINRRWRPLMAIIYMLTCTCDFVFFPVMWSMLQALEHGQVTSQWQPLTLQGAGLYHIAMGAVLGLAAYGRTKEKVAGVAS